MSDSRSAGQDRGFWETYLPKRRVIAENTWTKFKPLTCDICNKIARWSHPRGGYRCNTCPRPKRK